MATFREKANFALSRKNSYKALPGVTPKRHRRVSKTQRDNGLPLDFFDLEEDLPESDDV
jgi:hypothetical protein